MATFIPDPDLLRVAPIETRAPRYKDICMDLFNRSRHTYATWFQVLQEWYDAYRAFYDNASDPGWNNVPLPFIFSVIQSDIARKSGMVFGGIPTVNFVPTGQEDTQKARRAERLIEFQMRDANTFIKGSRFMLMADLYGVAVWKRRWLTKYGSRWRRAGVGGQERVQLEPNRRTGSLRRDFDGPDWVVMDPADFFPMPGYIDIEDMPGVVEREYMELEDVILNGMSGPDGQPAIFDKNVVDAMLQTSPSRVVNEERQNRFNMAASGLDDQVWGKLPDFSMPVEILNYWGRVPMEMGAWVDRATGMYSYTSSDGMELPTYTTEFLITVADRMHLLRARPNPYWDEKKPFGAYRPFEDPHFFHSPGKTELTYWLQAGAIKQGNNRLDILDQFVSPPWAIDEDAGIDVDDLRTAPNAVIQMKGKPKDVIQQLVPDLRGTQLTYQEISAYWEHMQRVVGVAEDIGLGLTGKSGRQTAREFVGRQEAVSLRTTLEVRQAEETWLQPIARGFLDMNRQFLDLQQEIDLIGSHSVWDSTLGRFVLPEREDQRDNRVTLEDLNIDMDVRAVGLTRTISKSAKAQNSVALLQVLAPFAGAINMQAFIRQTLQWFDYPNVDEIMNTDAQAKAAVETAVALANANGEDGGLQEQAIASLISSAAPSLVGQGAFATATR